MLGTCNTLEINHSVLWETEFGSLGGLHHLFLGVWGRGCVQECTLVIALAPAGEVEGDALRYQSAKHLSFSACGLARCGAMGDE